MEAQIERTFTPPYNISFRTFLNLLQRMEEEGGTPPRIDRSYLRSLSGQAQTYLMGALRSFGLIGENGDVTAELDALVSKSQDRPKLLAEILRRCYSGAIEHGEMHGTPKQLEEVFAQFNVSGDTLRKAMTFYLHAAEFAGLPISRYVKLRKVAPRRPPMAPRRLRPGTPAPSAADLHVPPELTAELRKEYDSKLMERALADGEPNAELLNRIERLLGYPTGDDPRGNGQEE